MRGLRAGGSTLSIRAPTGARREAERRVTHLTFVGTSDAFGAGGRRQSAILLRCASGGVLLDCGATTGSGLHQLGIAIDEIDLILVSHFHGDHFGGIPLLLLDALYDERRKRALRIAGPPGIDARVQRLAAALVQWA